MMTGRRCGLAPFDHVGSEPQVLKFLDAARAGWMAKTSASRATKAIPSSAREQRLRRKGKPRLPPTLSLITHMDGGRRPLAMPSLRPSGVFFIDHEGMFVKP